MQRFARKIGPLRKIAQAAAVKRFLVEQETRGIILADGDVPGTLAQVRTVLIDSSLIMEGWNAVRMVAAPLSVCPIEQYKRQGSWMMLTAGVSLAGRGSGPLENFAREMNFQNSLMARQYPKVFAVTVESPKQTETTVHRDGDGFRAFTKGGTRAVLSRCEYVLDGKERPLQNSDIGRALQSAAEMERYGLETIAFATKALGGADEAETEREMTFLGIIGMGDLPSEHAPLQINRLRALGKRPVFAAKSAYSESAVRASGILREESSVLHASDMTFDSADALTAAGLSADAFMGVDNAMRRKLAWAIRRHEPTAILTQIPDGEILLSTGRAGVEDAVIRTGGLADAVTFLEQCQMLWMEYE
ncbi:MAG: hypothetical protein FWG37_04775 [Clostridia bacterium]|nr:hypothetical protein [Clostridia bacterium]